MGTVEMGEDTLLDVIESLLPETELAADLMPERHEHLTFELRMVLAYRSEWLAKQGNAIRQQGILTIAVDPRHPLVQSEKLPFTLELTLRFVRLIFDSDRDIFEEMPYVRRK